MPLAAGRARPADRNRHQDHGDHVDDGRLVRPEQVVEDPDRQVGVPGPAVNVVTTISSKLSASVVSTPIPSSVPHAGLWLECAAA